MFCPRCESPRKSFPTEIAIHFSGSDSLKKTMVWLFPKVEICLNCGRADFVVPDRERRVLIDRKPIEGAMVSE